MTYPLSFAPPALAALAIAATLSACSSDSANTTLADTTDDAGPGEVFRSAIGDVLTFGAASRTLYTFANDSDGVSNCNGGCAVTWPPITTATARDTGEFSTLTRDDDTLQWALNGRALYYYEGDAAQGEINGEGIGGVWYVARRDPVTTGSTSVGETLVGRGTINDGSGDAATRNDYDGRTLYTFRNDSSGISTCNDACAANWPPLYADNGATAGGSFSIIVRDDDTRQWAYDGRALYFYQGDSVAGDTNGDGVGGVWDIAQPAN